MKINQNISCNFVQNSRVLLKLKYRYKIKIDIKYQTIVNDK